MDTLTFRQIAAIRRLTNKMQAARHDGHLTFSLERVAGDAWMLSASNSEDLRWFESRVFVLGFVGPLGGWKMRQCEGIRF
jgi:hypothetical protein